MRPTQEEGLKNGNRGLVDEVERAGSRLWAEECVAADFSVARRASRMAYPGYSEKCRDLTTYWHGNKCVSCTFKRGEYLEPRLSSAGEVF